MAAHTLFRRRGKSAGHNAARAAVSTIVEERGDIMQGRKSKLASLVSGSLLAIVAAVAAPPGAAGAAEDIWLKLVGIEGEATDDRHKNEIVLLSYSQSFTNPASAAARQTNCGVVKVTKLIDKSSPALIGGVALGNQYPQAVIAFRKAGETPEDYYKVTLTEVRLDSIIQTDASPTEATILEQLSMTAATIKFEYTSKPGGIVTFGWDCRKNVSF
jgi:type VI secretion system secreted protein Hcp